MNIWVMFLVEPHTICLKLINTLDQQVQQQDDSPKRCNTIKMLARDFRN